MHVLLAAESSGGIAALGINWTGLIFQFINFGILFVVLKKYAFPAILRLLENRRQQIEMGLREAAEAKKAKEQAEVERRQVLENARKEAEAVIESARLEARKEAERITAEAQAAASTKVTTAEQRIARASREARAELMNELGAVVATATAAVTREEVTPKADAAVIKRSLQEASR